MKLPSKYTPPNANSPNLLYTDSVFWYKTHTIPPLTLIIRTLIIIGTISLWTLPSATAASTMTLQSGISQWLITPETQSTFGEWSQTPSDTFRGTSEDISVFIPHREVIAQYLTETVSPDINQVAVPVTISTDHQTGAVVFEGAAIPGRQLDIERTTDLIAHALKSDAMIVQAAVRETDPIVTVNDPALVERGIRELIAVGESDFSGSPTNRIHNITVGAERFNGYMIAQGTEANFNNQLGDVTAEQGYRNEKVIIGDKIEKEMGGGICQVSTTAFRAALLSGLPITERWNHSFAVTYYAPQGTDATIWLGGKNLRWMNDTPGDILVQTTIDSENKILRFHFYGTRDERSTRIVDAQRYLGSQPISAESANRLAAQAKGFDADLFRAIESPHASTFENYPSHYRTKPAESTYQP